MTPADPMKPATGNPTARPQDPLIAAAAERVQGVCDAHALHQQAYLDAEQAFIGEVAAGHAAGRLDWRAVHEAYKQVRAWSTANDIDKFSIRWQQQIPVDPITLGRRAAVIPPNRDGTWSGNTGWEGLDDGEIPPRGVRVAFALFDRTGTSVRTGRTAQFRAYTKRYHRAGTRWESWTARPCADQSNASTTGR